MFLAFFVLLMLNGVVGVVVWMALRRMQAYMRANPEAAKLIGEIIAQLLAGELPKGEPPKPEVKKARGTLV